MPAFDSIVLRILSDRRLFHTLLLGGLLCFIPGPNLFAFGYLYAYVRKVRRKGDWSLIEWNRWDILLTDGLRFFALWVAFFLAPILGAGVLAWLVTKVFPSWADPAAWLMVSMATLLAPLWFAVMLQRYQERELWVDLRLERPGIEEIKFLLPRVWYPLLAVVGMFALTAPLYGFALFVGLLLFIPYVVGTLESWRRSRAR